MDFGWILSDPGMTWDYGGVHVYPAIPARKLKGALGAYAPEVAPEAVLVLLDDTVFGGARNGLLVTRDALHAKPRFGQPTRLGIAQIRDIAPETEARMRVNGDIFYDAMAIDHAAMLTLAVRLSAVIQQRNQAQASAQASARQHRPAPPPRQPPPASEADILGVRPNASRNEIELAYQRRRSQYHPDRYQGEGEQALRWATVKMQELTQAYRTLMQRAG